MKGQHYVTFITLGKALYRKALYIALYRKACKIKYMWEGWSPKYQQYFSP